MTITLSNLVDDFTKIAQIAGISMSSEDITSEVLSLPHRRPTILPVGKQTVYVFATASICLKVGKAGAKSGARFTSQHYSPGSSQSNLSRSILRSKNRLQNVLSSKEYEGIADLNEDNVGEWLERQTSRIHFFIDASFGDEVLSLLEAFIRCRLKPIFEGPRSGRR